jgi:hypothetical protein
MYSDIIRKVSPEKLEVSCYSREQLVIRLKKMRQGSRFLGPDFNVRPNVYEEVLLSNATFRDHISTVMITQRSRVQTRPWRWIFKGDKNPQHIFLRMGSKDGGPMS